MILVRQAGIQSSIQDMGRYGYQHLGVSPSGVMDSNAYELSNHLVGNPVKSPCIETTYGGLVLEFFDDMAIAITGAYFEAKLNNHSVALYETIYVIAGDILTLGHPSKGVYGYIAFSKALDLKPFLGSYATDLKSAIGGIDGKKLYSGQKIITKAGPPTTLVKRVAPKALWTAIDEFASVSVLAGAEINRFSREICHDFFNEPFQIAVTSNRMGYRLNGPKIISKSTHDIISGGLTKGTIQVTAKGELIIMMADHQATGGYSRIANVAAIDLPIIAQMRPGTSINFNPIDLETAHQGLKKRQMMIERWLGTCPARKAELITQTLRFNIKVNHKRYSVLLKEIQ